MLNTDVPVTIRTFEDAERRLAETLPRYQARPEQQEYARAVEAALGSGGHLIAQAGCGVGKSLGYMIPAILSGKRTVVATATKALQDQIANKDLPFLAEHLGVDFSYALLKGRSNYLCQAKANEAMESEPSVASLIALADAGAADERFMAERGDFDFEIPDAIWRKITATSDECPGKKKCPFGATCFSEKAKKAAKDADIVVVNHALLATDMLVRELTFGTVNMLDNYEVVILDEGHEFEEYVSSALGNAFSEASLIHLTGEVRNFLHRVPDADTDRFADLTRDAISAMATLWEAIEPGRIREAHLLAADDEFIALSDALNSIDDFVRSISLDTVPAGDEYDRAKVSKERLVRRAGSMSNRFNDVITASFDDLVRWVEIEKMRNGEERKVVRYAPIDVSAWLRKNLFDVTPTIITSATIAVEGNFSYISSRLGVAEYDGLLVDSPFDFERQSRLYIPTALPEPAGQTREAWEGMALSEMEHLINVSDGRALVLFTSTKQMREAYAYLSSVLPYRCLMQGQKPNKALAEEFAADESSVLFAVKSFMTGVDFQGATCSLVIVDKMPFPVPTDPIVEARSEAVERRGGNAFAEYVIPVMALTLIQAAGRLIRTSTDMGVVAILDKRLVSKGYGAKIVRSLPPMPKVTSRAEVESFFEAIEASV